MKKRLKSKLLLILACALTVTACSKATDDDITPTNAPTGSTEAASGNDTTPTSDDARYQTSGKVVVAANAGRYTDLDAMFTNFNKYYPNIELELVEYDSSTEDYLTAQATSNTMPDVILDDAGPLYYYVSQGWVYPLNEYVVGDADFDYVPTSIKESNSYNDRLYALPMHVNFNCMFVNTDLLETLNLDKPGYDWTPDEYVDLLKKATTDKYSGTEVLQYLNESLAGTLSPNAGFYGYSLEDGAYHLSDTWVEAVNVERELHTYPGLVSNDLRNSAENVADSDYAKKFGDGDLENTHMALRKGLILTDPRGTWDYGWINTGATEEGMFNWEFYPFPQAEDAKGHLPMHVDYLWMVSTAQAPDAAFEVVRYFSYSEEGNLERLGMYERQDEGLSNTFYIPATNHPTVREHFLKLPGVTEGLVYMYDNMENSFRADVSKVVPGWQQVLDEFINPLRDEVVNGTAEAASVAAELDTSATNAIQGHRADFDRLLEQVEADFDAKH